MIMPKPSNVQPFSSLEAPQSERFDLFQFQRAVAASDLKASERLVLLTIAFRANQSGQCWPSLSRVGEEAGLSKEAAKRHVRNLRKKKWLEVSWKPGETSFYTLRTGVACDPGVGSPETRVASDPGLQRPGGGVTTDPGVGSLATPKQQRDQQRNSKPDPVPSRGGRYSEDDFESGEDLQGGLQDSVGSPEEDPTQEIPRETPDEEFRRELQEDLDEAHGITRAGVTQPLQAPDPDDPPPPEIVFGMAYRDGLLHAYRRKLISFERWKAAVTEVTGWELGTVDAPHLDNRFESWMAERSTFREEPEGLEVRHG